MARPELFIEAQSRPTIDLDDGLSPACLALLRRVMELACESQQSLYLAGGTARDILLRLPHHDLDLVTEGDAIALARACQRRYGGSVLAHGAFGTAKWTLDEAVARSMDLAPDAIPGSLDFAAARSETYRRPGALPTAGPGDIRADMRRRDFSINALAIQLRPSEGEGELLDLCGGLDDLRAGEIRVLHEGSFLDDPTRILRALRYATRLNFRLEAGTETLLHAAIEALGRLTGTRLRNEIDHILTEAEPARILTRLESIGALSAIHPGLRLQPQVDAIFARAKLRRPPWQRGAIDERALGWHILLSGIDGATVGSIAECLSFTKGLRASLLAAANLGENLSLLGLSSARPSQLTRILDGMPALALHWAWLCLTEQPTAQANLERYMDRWRALLPATTGRDLQIHGLTPGPAYKRILGRLRDAWLDGELASTADERALLKALLTNERLSADATCR